MTQSDTQPLAQFRFRPRYRMLAWGAVLMGALLLGYAVYSGQARALATAMGLAGITLGLVYMASPVWRYRVVIYKDRLEVESAKATRFSVPFAEVQAFIASPSTNTGFVNGGSPERSLLVPGPGASASYDIEDKPRLFALLREHIAVERTQVVESLTAWRKAQGEQPVAVEGRVSEGGDADADADADAAS